MRRINIWVKDYQYEALHKIADETKDRVSEHIRRAIDKYLNKKK
jgi:hypothetical protein